MDFLDTSVLVAALVAEEEHHAKCRKLLLDGEFQVYAHGISEVFSTLTGGARGYRLSAGAVSEMLELRLMPRLRLISLTPAEMLRALREAESRGVRGGAVYDYFHLVAARKGKAEKFYTLDEKTSDRSRDRGIPSSSGLDPRGETGFLHDRRDVHMAVFPDKARGSRRRRSGQPTRLRRVRRADRRPGPSLRESPWLRGIFCPPHSSGGRWRCSAWSRRRDPQR